LVRLAGWQLASAKTMEDYRPVRPDRIKAARGAIIEATGNYLAVSTIEYEVGVTPRLIGTQTRKELVPTLAPLLGMSEEKLDDLLQQRDQEWVPLAKDLPASVGQQIEDLVPSGFVVRMNYKRLYPDKQVAASLLGFVDTEGVAQYGLERYYDAQLRGTDGMLYGVRDPWGQQILMSQIGYQPVQDGVDLVLTLDRNVQVAAERILAEGIASAKATSGNIIVLDARTGAILAMADYPTFDPGEYWTTAASCMECFVNTGVSAIYEPGSVVKPLTLASALEMRVIRPDDVYDDRGEIRVGGRVILNSDRRAHGRTTMAQILEKSLNVGAAHVANMMGPTRYYEMMRRFGFGGLTGADLSLEVMGIMRVPGDATWHISDLGANSYGQGISVTPLQVAAAFVALANQGYMMRPYIVSEIHNGEQVTLRQPFRMRAVVSPEVSQQITQMMVQAVEGGMRKAIVPGYRFAGKSGTAGIPDQEGYQSKDIIASFVGYGPIPDPRFVILVKFDKPREGYWGLDVAAPEFSRMGQFLVNYYGIPPTSVGGN
jgi:cell division protein FtsI/penicillin-binding protein 2